MAKKDYRAQLAASQEENVRLKFEIVGLRDQMEERIKQARRDERVMIGREIMETSMRMYQEVMGGRATSREQNIENKSEASVVLAGGREE